MKKLYFVSVLFSLLIFQAADTSGQTGKKAGVKQINAYCKGIDTYTSKNKKAGLIFADVSDFTANDKEDWRKFASEKTLENADKKTAIYSTAYAWIKGGRVVAANFSLSSPSGAWSSSVKHYFRTDGSLAKVSIDYRTFNGDYLILQNVYYDTAGRRLAKTTIYKDLTTHRRKKQPEDYLGPESEQLTGDVYKTTKKLPFAGLIGKASR